MANKVTSACGKLIAVLFTSIVAPLLVNLAARNSPEATSRPACSEQIPSGPFEVASPAYPAVPSLVRSPSAPPAQTVRVIASGVGRTPDAALQNAVGTALRQTLASLVDAETWSRNEATLCAGVLHDMGGILLGWEDLSSTALVALNYRENRRLPFWHFARICRENQTSGYIPALYC